MHNSSSYVTRSRNILMMEEKWIAWSGKALPLCSPSVTDLTKSVLVAASHTAPEPWGFNTAWTHISTRTSIDGLSLKLQEDEGNNCLQIAWLSYSLDRFAGSPVWCPGRKVRMLHLHLHVGTMVSQGSWSPRMGRTLGGDTCVCAVPPVLTPRVSFFCGFPPQRIWTWWMERRAAYTLLGILLGSSQGKLKLTWMKSWTNGL